jgi:hypothetical protein
VIPPQILTATGRYFDFSRPTADMIDIEDIAHALSRQNRFTGHTRDFYSVAQHSVAVSDLVPPEHALAGLLHDASEAYMADMNSPLKQLVPEYKAIEQRVEGAICARFGLAYPLDPCVKQADLRMLVTERRDLMPKPRPEFHATDMIAWSWARGIEPVRKRVYPQPSREAYLRFMLRFTELTK